MGYRNNPIVRRLYIPVVIFKIQLSPIDDSYILSSIELPLLLRLINDLGSFTKYGVVMLFDSSTIVIYYTRLPINNQILKLTLICVK